jgi:hypothetical protein
MAGRGSLVILLYILMDAVGSERTSQLFPLQPQRKTYTGMSPMQPDARIGAHKRSQEVVLSSLPAASEGGEDPLRFLREITDSAGVEVAPLEAGTAFTEEVSEEELKNNGECCTPAASKPLSNLRALPETSKLRLIVQQGQDNSDGTVMVCSTTIPWVCCHRDHESSEMIQGGSSHGVWTNSEVEDCLLEQSLFKAKSENRDLLLHPAAWGWVHMPVTISKNSGGMAP